MKYNTLKKQAAILKENFGIEMSIPKTIGEAMVFIPSWEKVGKTYPEAVQNALNAIKKSRPFYNWREGQIDDKHIRQLSPRNFDGVYTVQMGEKYKGRSVADVRKSLENVKTNEVLMGAYEASMALLLNPKILAKYDDLWIDCSGDEFSWNGNGTFSRSPVLCFYDDEARFDAWDVGFANDRFGAASVFLPQSNLGTCSIEPSESLSLESAIKIVKAAGLKVYEEK